MDIEVSIIVPIHNAEQWLDDSVLSISTQSFEGSLQLSVYLDSCTDGSKSIVEKWKAKLSERNIDVIHGGHDDSQPRGVGYAKNCAVRQSTGKYLCFFDADDMMHEDRVSSQYEACKAHPKCIIGSKFRRLPEDSTVRFTEWANNLTQDQLYTQAYTSHGPTLIMPTWFCTRDVYDQVGGFNEAGKGVPEDLLFFYRHIELGGCLYKVEKELLTYRYHMQAATFSVKEETIWNHRVEFLQKQVLSKWPRFTIWNAGKQGRKLFRSLNPENQSKVGAFCDVDEKKIQNAVYIYEVSKVKPKPRIPIVHFTDAEPPFIICVKMGLTKGEFEKNLDSLKLMEGHDYYHFN